jgi:hypothetical protein
MCNLPNILFGTPVDKIAMWTAILTVVTLSAVLVAWRQLSGLRAISQADFTYRFIDSFFQAETRTLITLLSQSALKFEIGTIQLSSGIPTTARYFVVDQTAVSSNPDLFMIPNNKKIYSDAEIDDLLLGHFESLGLYVRKGLIDFDFAYSSFSYYVISAYENKEISEYVADVGSIAYGDFANLYKRFKNRDQESGRERPPPGSRR